MEDLIRVSVGIRDFLSASVKFIAPSVRVWFARNWFIPALFGAVGLAWIFPEAGSPGGLLRPEITTKSGVAIIFLLQGMSLSLPALRAGALQWRLHCFIQGFTFLVIPLLVLGVFALVPELLPADLRIGFIFLAVLPSTISTAVVFTVLVQGNAAAAIFNSTLSNVAGVVLTPFWIALILRTTGEVPPLGGLLAQIAALLLLPLIAGQILRPWIGRWADAQRKRLNSLNSLIILFIIYAAFSNSIQSGVWREAGLGAAGEALIGSLILFCALTALAGGAATAFGFSPADRKAALFCAPQKTLAAGAAMGKVIFSAHAGLGLILLPLMIYHLVQLLLGGVLIGWLNRSSEETVERARQPVQRG